MISSSTLTSTLVRKVSQATDTSLLSECENKCVDVSKDYENYFNATILEKVNTKCRGPEIHTIEEEFYPTLYMLVEFQDYTTTRGG